MEKATFAAGCFWGVEAAFRRVEGVTETQVGYTGGRTENPIYSEVCGGRSGHAEAVEVSFDPQQVSFERLLAVFWGCHDPTQRDGQGPDVGSQYRSAIFVHSAEQEAAVKASMEALDCEGRFIGPIVTQVGQASTFWRAEDYHQRYVEKHGGGGCAIGPSSSFE